MLSRIYVDPNLTMWLLRSIIKIEIYLLQPPQSSPPECKNKCGQDYPLSNLGM